MYLQVAVSTLSLFNVLFEFYCEDFWYEVILKYLLPQNHLMVSQRNSLLPKIDFYDSSLRFLNLVPLSVVETLGSDTVTSHYVQYLNSESQRWVNLDTMIGVVPCSQVFNEDTNIDTKRTNSMYPMWKRNYDGTDLCDSNKLEIFSKKGSTDVNNTKHKLDSNSNENLHTNTNSSINNKSSTKVNHDPLSSPHCPGSPKFTTINLQAGSVLDDTIPTTSPSVNSFPGASINISSSDSKESKTMEETIPVLERLSVLNGSDETMSMESSGSPVSDDPCNTIGSFGPFLDTIFVQLSNWPNLDLNVILMLTEVVSILASSRIPLITSLLLDPNLTLQPCSTSFNTLLKRIRQDLEYHMQKVPSEILTSVWELMDPKETHPTSRRTSNGPSSPGMFAVRSLVSPSSSLGEQIGDTIRRRIAGGGSTGAIANVLHLFNRKINSPSTSPRVNPSSGTEVLTSLEGSQGYR